MDDPDEVERRILEESRSMAQGGPGLAVQGTGIQQNQ
jgi:hypothetical protein